MHDNPYLNSGITKTFVSAALPIIMFMTAHGLYGVVDAYFLGKYIGAKALSAVTLTFPVQALIFAISNLFAKGMASIVARKIGEGDIDRARDIFVSSNYISLFVFLLFSVVYFLVDDYFLVLVVGPSPELYQLSSEYISILVFFSPIIGLLILNNDALRSEGRVRFMSLAMIGSALLNIVFDYVFIAEFGWGVSASAYATVLAYAIPLFLVVVYRLKGNSIFTYQIARTRDLNSNFVNIVSLGFPVFMAHLGVALCVGVVNYSIKTIGGSEFSDLVAAYGVVARLMTFVMFPLIGMTIAFQSILGNNFGAKETERSNKIISVGLLVSFLYCTTVELVVVVWSFFGLGDVFVDDEIVSRNMEIISRYVFFGFFAVGPVAILAAKFQALGSVGKAFLLGPSKSLFVVVPLVLLFSSLRGIDGLWLAIPVSDLIVTIMAFVVVMSNSRRESIRGGIYFIDLRCD